MPRKSEAEKQFMAVVSALQFIPTPEMRDAKSSFWLAVEENPIVDMSSMNLAGIIQLTGEGKISKWWALDGFRDWFTNKEEFKIKMESASHKAVEVLMEIMQNPDANPAARVNAAKLVIEASGKNAARSQADGQVSDKAIQKMGPQELEAYIASKAKLINKPESK